MNAGTKTSGAAGRPPLCYFARNTNRCDLIPDRKIEKRKRGDKPDPGSSAAPWRVYNIGNNNPVDVPKVVAILEKELGRTAKKEMLPMQPGDVPATYADVDDLMREVDFRPATPIEEGIALFVTWYREWINLRSK